MAVDEHSNQRRRKNDVHQMKQQWDRAQKLSNPITVHYKWSSITPINSSYVFRNVDGFVAQDGDNGVRSEVEIDD